MENTEQKNAELQQNTRQAEKRDLVMALFALVSAVLCVWWGVWGYLASGWAITYVVFFFVGTLYLSKPKHKVSAFALACGILSLALSSVFIISYDYGIRLLSFAAMIILGTIWFASLAGHKIPDGDTGLVKFVGMSFANAFTYMPKSIKSLFTSQNAGKKKATGAILGLICAIPVLCAVMPLLVSSDAAFEGLIGGMFDDFETTIVKIIFVIIIAPFLISFLFTLSDNKKMQFSSASGKGFGTAFGVAFMTALNLCYLVYLFSQLAYFFSAFSGFLPYGYAFSYAEYARRGFFEMCTIAAINLAVMLALIAFSKKTDNRIPALLGAEGVFTGMFTLMLIATALSKMIMYINNYGMTLKRVSTSAFMIFMAVVFLAAIARCRFAKIKVLHTAAITAGVVLLILGAGNSSSFIARYNCSAYESGKLRELDVEYISQLSADGVPYLVRLAENGNKEAAKRLARALPDYFSGSYEDIIDKDENGDTVVVGDYFVPDGKRNFTAFYEMNIPLSKAYKSADRFLSQNKDFFKANPEMYYEDIDW